MLSFLKNLKLSYSVSLLSLLVVVDIMLTLGGRDRGLDIIERLKRMEANQHIFVEGLAHRR